MHQIADYDNGKTCFVAMVEIDPSAEFFGDVRLANRIFRPIFSQPQISRPITASIFSGGFSAYFATKPRYGKFSVKKFKFLFPWQQVSV